MLDPISPRSIPFPTFGFSAKHPIMRLVQSWNALPLHSIMCPIPLGGDPLSLKGVPEIWESTHQLILMGVTPGSQSWAPPGAALTRVWTGWCPFLWVCNLGSLPKILAVYKKHFLWRMLENVFNPEVCEVFRWAWELSALAERSFLKGIQIINPYATCLNSAGHFSFRFQVIFLSCFFMHQY